MADYRRCICIACRNEFEPDDDIVVCPQCGTPYHRDCWNEYGHCINTELHEKGETWKNPNNNEKEKERERVICPNCGELSDKGSTFCSHCGNPLEGEDSGNQGGFAGEGNDSRWQGAFPGGVNIFGAENPSEDLGGASAGELKDFVGKNTPYFLMRFRFFHGSGKKFAPNFICVLFPQFWFAYRKMRLWTIAIIAVTFLLSIPGLFFTVSANLDSFIMTLRSQQTELGTEMYNMLNEKAAMLAEFVEANYSLLYCLNLFGSYASMAMHILLFLFGNYIYYRHCLKKIKNIRENNASLMDLQSRLRIAGGTSIGFIFIALAIEVALTSAIVYALVLM
ncbi:MAG: RING finger protein [Oscillospiraceae bacterium]|nr:RING finger protein [Oscillospiraceae bacterium]